MRRRKESLGRGESIDKQLRKQPSLDPQLRKQNSQDQHLRKQPSLDPADVKLDERAMPIPDVKVIFLKSALAKHQSKCQILQLKLTCCIYKKKKKKMDSKVKFIYIIKCIY